jgi:hypothetical protein
MKRSNALWAVLLLLPALAWANPEDRPQRPDEKLNDYLNEVAPLEEAAAVDATAKKAAIDATVSQAISEQAVSPAGTANASGFADRVGNTLQNFLPLLQGAVDAVNTSEDKKTVTVRFNPVRGATFGELGLTASATEPEPSEALLELLPDDTRPGQKEAIEKTLDDFTDLTYAASYNYVRKLEPEHLTSPSLRRWFFGRNPRLYEEVFADLVGDTLRRFPPRNKALDPFFDRFPDGVDIEGLTRKDLESQLGVTDYQHLVESMILGRRSLVANFVVQAKKRAELFGQLVANQPQATLSGIYHDRDPLVGRNETSFDLAIEMPAEPNINELLRSWRRAGRDWQKALDDLAAREEEIKAGTKWSIAASYKEARSYKVSYQPTTEGAEAISLDRPGSHELTLKAQYTRNATWQKLIVDGIATYPALHISAELIDVSGDPDRNDRRVVATLTYDVPVRKGVSFPISLVYANRSEFLGDPDRQLSAHFGLNLNSLFGD